jgi:hypothetical protein
MCPEKLGTHGWLYRQNCNLPEVFEFLLETPFKEGFQQKIKTSYKLQFCLQNQPFVLFFPKTVPNISRSISEPELTQRPVLYHPGASTSPSDVQYFTIRGQYFTIHSQYFTIRGQYLKKNHERLKKMCIAIPVSLTLHDMKE